MYRFATDAPIDLEEFRARLQKMTDAQLLRFDERPPSSFTRMGSLQPTVEVG